ncbi:MAG: enoyl-CoA hydratase [SAR202 cluster bacterium]|nr:enoyl-CoA hydratase [Chloroflexota bacterium]MDP6422990.1 enoyl-CoA hydratase-related protein [SAR202 cluster bacterium]HAL49073.1 enoyl-CoA hydratase [Dehalococcoidia bacterium]MDP6664467.1 enoyl-CoA hydratase-related protein [SAR202 cluster bacterium]MDP6800321.1 enoyl-CoA hydratase-related protein [SAR202 cluster bacterium]|tara:strand:- start:9161 stop:9940 length:780 start_codon:yes stop_codon:yes gene_type:complete
MAYEQILTEVRGRVGILTMNRPDRLNAMTRLMDQELRTQIAEWNEDDSIGAIVWTGAGRGFCSGADISGFEARVHGVAPDERPAPPEQTWIDMIKSAKPVVAAINGASIGEGLTRTLTCDVRVAAESARLSFRFLRVGVTPEVASTHYAVYLIGLGRTLELMLTGEIIMAAEAYRIGLVNHVYPDDEMLDKAVELATNIADNPTWNLGQVKRLVHQDYLEHDIDKVLADESVIFRESQGREAHREALEAFRENRPPKFH